MGGTRAKGGGEPLVLLFSDAEVGVASPAGGAWSVSGGGSCCMLPCREAPEPGSSQLSVRRLELSCIRLVATTAFIAAWNAQHTRTVKHCNAL